MPVTAADLQHLLCATNWIRDSLIDYARVVAPMQLFQDKVLVNKSRKKRFAEGIVVPWDADAKTSYSSLITLLSSATKLTFLVHTATVCLCTDPSNLGWAVVETQEKNGIWRHQYTCKLMNY